MTIAIRELSVPRMQRKVYQGQSVNITAIIEDEGLTSPLLDVEPPRLHIFNPSDVKIVDSAVMTRVSAAIFTRTVQTANQPLGVYTATCIATYNDDIAIIEKTVVFKIIRLVADSDLPTFNVLAIKDQSGHIWYWYIAGDDTVESVDVQPDIPGYAPIDIDTVTVPYWLAGQDPAFSNVWIYPSLSGEPTVAFSQPIVGTGLDSIPSLVGINPYTYQIFVNDADEVDVVII